MTKVVKVYRGGSETPITLKNGDKYDSRIEVYDERGAIIFRCDKVNTDPTVNHKGGIIAPMVGNFICDYHTGIGKIKPYKALIIFNICSEKRFLSVLTKDDLTDGERTFKSTIPNPTHDGRYEISYVNVHRGGYNEDVSRGCITIHPEFYSAFISVFKMGEKGLLEIIEDTKKCRRDR